MELLFDRLTAFFSPLVSRSIKREWLANGGTIIDSHNFNHEIGEFPHVFFGTEYVNSDILVQRLMAIGIEIIDCRWIQSSVKENRLVSLDPFVVAPPLILEQGFPLKGVANYNEEELVEQDSVAKSITLEQSPEDPSSFPAPIRLVRPKSKMNQVTFPRSSSSPASGAVSKSIGVPQSATRAKSAEFLPIQGSSRDLGFVAGDAAQQRRGEEWDEQPGAMEEDLIEVKEEDLNDSAFFESPFPTTRVDNRHSFPSPGRNATRPHHSVEKKDRAAGSDEAARTKDHPVNLFEEQHRFSPHSIDLNAVNSRPIGAASPKSESSPSVASEEIVQPILISSVLDSLPTLVPEIFITSTSSRQSGSEEEERGRSQTIRRGLGTLEQGVDGFEATKSSKKRKVAP